MAQFGKFPSLSAFLESFAVAQKRRLAKEIIAGAATPAEVIRRIKKLQQQRPNVVEINAILVHREPDDTNPSGGRHVQLLATVQKILKSAPDVAADLKDAQRTRREIFIAIRVGDSQGILEPIKGLKTGAALHLRGEWITREKAKSHGGARMSVLHFTHHPVGFTCTPVKCYM